MVRIYNPATLDITTASFTVMAVKYNFRPEAIESQLAEDPTLRGLACCVRADPDTAFLFGYSITFKVLRRYRRTTKLIETANRIVGVIAQMERRKKKDG